jgi:hypothetical protein
MIRALKGLAAKLAFWRKPVAVSQDTQTAVAFPAVSAVLNMPAPSTTTFAASPAPIVAAGRTIRHKHCDWQEIAVDPRTGIVTCTREIAVSGRPVTSELRVHYTDLVPLSDGSWTIMGHP